jgi:hypothetical protein
MTGRPSVHMPVLIWTVLIVAFYLAHQDIWFWQSARPLIFGFLPIGLAYHAAYCLGASLMMWTLTTFTWPAHLERSSTMRAPNGD